MAILPQVGRKSLRLKLVIYGIYVVLILGSITMIYPFLIMLSGSVKGLADIEKMDIIPEVFYSEHMQFVRFQEDRYGVLATVSAAYGRELYSGRDAEVPDVDKKELDAYSSFVGENIDDFPDHFYLVQGITADSRILPQNFRKFRDQVKRECEGIEVFNKRYDSALASWNEFPSVLDSPLTKEFSYEQDPLTQKYVEFKRSRPRGEKAILNLDGYYYNTQKSFPSVRNEKASRGRILHAKRPDGEEGKLWTEFVKHHFNCLFVRLDPEGLKLFRKHLVRKYPRGVAELNRINDTSYSSFDEIGASYEEMRIGTLFTLA